MQTILVDLVSPEMRCALECGRSCLFYTVKEGVCRWFRHKTLEPPDMSFDTFIQTKLYVGAPCELKSFSLLIYRQDSTGGTFWTPNMIAVNVHDPTATRYAIFDEIDDWRAQDGQLHFKLCYPGKYKVYQKNRKRKLQIFENRAFESKIKLCKKNPFVFPLRLLIFFL